MRIRSAEFAGSVVARGTPPPGDHPQIAFSGRSNVGKSSLINTLLRRTRHKIAHVSATPGKTQSLNYYRVNDAFYLVDLPGYGFARVPQEVRDAWRSLVEWYLGESGQVQGVVHLVDARHAPTEHDRSMVEYLAQIGIPALIVLTKMDKLKAQQRRDSLERALRELRIDEEQLVPFSSKTGEGREALLSALDGLLGDPVQPRKEEPR